MEVGTQLHASQCFGRLVSGQKPSGTYWIGSRDGPISTLDRAVLKFSVTRAVWTVHNFSS
jgi:hypothetical protein